MTLDRHRHLLIAGTHKAGTTSLFVYLAAHPEVCAAARKETYFFLDADYPIDAGVRVERAGPAAYEAFFRAAPGRPVRLEGTPDYLYSPGCPERIARHLADPRIVIVLREPIDRLRSWHRFALQQGRLPAGTGFADFLRPQLEAAPAASPLDLALRHGRYAPHVARYLEVLGRDRVCVLFFEEFRERPRDTVRQICALAGLAAAPYDDYHFAVHNPSVHMRQPAAHHAYLRLLRRLRAALPPGSALRRALSAVRRNAEPAYIRLNAAPGRDEPIPDALRAELDRYYRGDRPALEALLGRPVPWPPAPR
jgi:hypothetical protein